MDRIITPDGYYFVGVDVPDNLRGVLIKENNMERDKDTGRLIGSIEDVAVIREGFLDETISAGINPNNHGNSDHDTEPSVRAEMAERAERHRESDV